MIDLIAYQGSSSPVVYYSTIRDIRYDITPTRTLVKRSDDSSDSSSTSKHATKSKSEDSKCTGSKQQCELPTNSKHTTAVTVGVAVAIPVFVVIVILCAILYVVYKRSKREAQEDNDPDFEGDSEYLPHQNTYEMHNQYSSSDSNQVMKEKVDQAFYNGMSMAPPGASMQQYPQRGSMGTGFGSMPPNPFENNNGGNTNRNSSWTADPFQLPETENADSLREFAKQIQNDGLGGYQLASRNSSQVSLHNDQTSFVSTNRLSNMRIMTNHSDMNNPILVPNETSDDKIRMISQTASRHTSPLKNDHGTNHLVEDTDTTNYNDNTQNLSSRKLDFTEEVETFGNNENNFVDDGFEFEVNDNNNNRVEPQHLVVNDKEVNDDEYATNIPLTPEEENIQRMKSIYKVYLDKNEVTGQDPRLSYNEYEMEDPDTIQEPHDDIPPQPQPQPQQEFVDTSPQKESQVTEQSKVNIPQIQIQQDMTENVQPSTELNDESNLNDNRISHRIASSIYSEAPVQAYQSQYQQQFNYNPQQQQQQYGYDQQPAYDMMQQGGYNQQQMYNNYPPLPNMPSQYIHPQTLEHIDELPMPSKLINSNSSHSLTSFKQGNKQQQLQQMNLQTARLNGTALNPMDHPDMFYSNNGDQMYGMNMQQPQYPGNSSMSFVSNNSQSSKGPSPHQLRKSVVMTNPAELQMATTYKPAGSIRNLGGNGMINNDQMDPYYQQQQQINSRVSGLLENNDMVQPPSVGGILPHSGSQDDLRKQLGSSDNYNV